MALLQAYPNWLHINRRLLYLKLCYFLIYSARIASLPYVSLISTQIVTYEQLAILFAFIPASSILGPIIIGFIADKTGNYKLIMIIALLVGVAAHSSILWLQSAVDAYSDVSNSTDLVNISWNGSMLQLHYPFDVAHQNVSTWLQVLSCTNATSSCLQSIDWPVTIQMDKASGQSSTWIVHNGLARQTFESCDPFDCSVSVVNSTSSHPSGGQSFIFPLLLIIRVVGFVTVDSVTPLLDATAVYMTKLHGGDFGRQKMWAYWSFVVIPIICGSIIDLIEQYTGFKEYGAAFAISGLTAVAAIPLIFKLDVHVHKNRESMIKTAKAVGRRLDVNLFFVVEVVVGLCWGFHINYIAIYLDTELKASKTFLGTSLSVNGIGAMTVLAIGTSVVSRLGQANSVALGLLFYCTRFVSFYFLQNVWIVLVLESLEGFCGFIAFLAGTYFCAAAAPPGMLASLNGILSAAFYGAGRGLGTSVGSALISRFGIRATYLAFGTTAGTTGVVYLVLYHWWLKKIEKKRLETRQSQMQGNANPAVDCAESADPPAGAKFENAHTRS